MTKEEKINSLIANKATKFEETDREWLGTFSEKELDVLEPKMQRNTEAKEINVEDVKTFIQGMEPKNVIELLPTEIQANLKAMEEEKAKKVNDLVEGIMANTESIWEKEELQALSIEKLEKIAKSVKVETADYSANGVQVNRNSKEKGEEPLLPMDVKFVNQ